MARLLVALLLVCAAASAGCRSAKPEYGFRCTHRAMEAGFCDEFNAPAPDPIREPG